MWIQVSADSKIGSRFPVDAIRLHLNEDTPVSAVVYVLEVPDDDDDACDGCLRYSLTNVDRDRFSIGSRSGVIRLRQPLDYETCRRYAFSVVIDDRRFASARVQEVTIEVFVDDVNDNVPVFGRDAYTCETSAVGVDEEEICSVVAFDSDSDLNGRVGYFLEGSTNSEIFSVDSRSGVLRRRTSQIGEGTEKYLLSVIAVDGSRTDSDALSAGRRRHAEYYLKIIATDYGFPYKTATAQVVVQARSSIQVHFSDDLYALSIEENQPAYTAVGVVSATSKLASGFLRYSLKKGSDYFLIERDTGKILTRSPLDAEEIRVHSLVVLVAYVGVNGK